MSTLDIGEVTSSDARDDALRLASTPRTVAHVGTIGRRTNLRRVLMICDLVALIVAWTVTLVLPGLRSGGGAPRVVLVLAGAVGLSLGLIALQRLYLSRVCTLRAEETVRLLRASGLAAVGVYGIGIALEVDLSLVRVAFGTVLALFTLLFARAGYRAWLSANRRVGRFVRPVLVIGANDEAIDLDHLLRSHPELGFRIAGMVGRRHEAEQSEFDAPWVGDVDDVLGAMRRTGATGAIVATSALPPSDLNRVVRDLIQAGHHVHLSNGLRGIASRRLRSTPFAHEPLFYLERASLSKAQLVVKRIIDIVAASAALVLSLPVLAAAAIIIKLSDRGPVLFKQVRIGRHGAPFTVYKLRTMVVDAEQRVLDLAGQNERDGVLFKLAADPRVTRVGRMLRSTSIDELPQLFNVLNGTMSIVGPRPALPSEVAKFDEELLARMQVKPGITGLWQVEARDNPAFAAYRRLDLFYVENWSLGFDLAIMLSTALVVASRAFVSVLAKDAELSGS